MKVTGYFGGKNKHLRFLSIPNIVVEKDHKAIYKYTDFTMLGLITFWGFCPSILT